MFVCYLLQRHGETCGADMATAAALLPCCPAAAVPEALRMHSSDNVTVIAVCFNQDPPKRRVYGNGRFNRSMSREALTTLAQVLGQQRLS
jgi:hypothetical protein